MSDHAQFPISQNLKKYNRESGRKTLAFVGILITLIVLLTIISLILISTKPNILTSSIDNQPTPAPSPALQEIKKQL